MIPSSRTKLSDLYTLSQSKLLRISLEDSNTLGKIENNSHLQRP